VQRRREDALPVAGLKDHPVRNLGPAQVRGVPGPVSFSRKQAGRAWEIALRLKEQGNRLGAHQGISQSLPESALDPHVLEGQIQLAARRLEAATGVTATSFILIDKLEHFGSGGTHLRLWQY
jgi:hypothetical protein